MSHCEDQPQRCLLNKKKDIVEQVRLWLWGSVLWDFQQFCWKNFKGQNGLFHVCVVLCCSLHIGTMSNCKNAIPKTTEREERKEEKVLNIHFPEYPWNEMTLSLPKCLQNWIRWNIWEKLALGCFNNELCTRVISAKWSDTIGVSNTGLIWTELSTDIHRAGPCRHWLSVHSLIIYCLTIV